MIGSREYLYFKVPSNTFTSSNVAHLHQNVPLGSCSSMRYLGTMVGIRYNLLCQELPTNSGYFPCQKDRVEVHRIDTHLGTGVITEDTYNNTPHITHMHS